MMAMRRGVKFAHEDPFELASTPPPADEIQGIKIVRDNLYAGVAKSCGIWPFKRIVIGSLWDEMNQVERQAVLLHEIRHCQKPHKEERFALLVLAASPLIYALPWQMTVAAALSFALGFLWEWRSHRQEYEADEFAATNGYGTALAQFLTKQSRLYPPPDPFHPPNEDRILRLKKIIEGKKHET